MTRRTETHVTTAAGRLIVICRDGSPSMHGRNAARAAEATRALVRSIAPAGFRVALIDFDDEPHVVRSPLPAAALLPKLPALEARGAGTDLARALALAGSLSIHEVLRPAIVLVSDGRHNGGSSPHPVAARLKERAEIFALAVGPSADQALLESLASSSSDAIRCGRVQEVASRLLEAARWPAVTAA
jgi:Mg-chelatase subunit ChlD